MITNQQHEANVKHIASVGSKLVLACQLLLAAPIIGFFVLIFGLIGLGVLTSIFG